MQNKLFVFTIKRTYTDKVRESKYQIPAKNRDEALIKLGQNFNNAKDEYELELLEG